ncbi:hypothetical protein J132_07660, partial [Termitomyces sp. J132]
FYDHLITFGKEVTYLWLRPKTQSAYWFFFNRYFAFLGNIVVIVLEQMDLSSDAFPISCRRFNLFRQILLVLNQVLVCILLTLRTYALYNCSFRILTYMVGSGMVLAAIACVCCCLLCQFIVDDDTAWDKWALFGQKSAPGQEVSGCHIGLSHLAGAWEALFAYDSILFGLTMFRTWKNRSEFLFSQAKNSLIYLLFRDGAIYFAVMAFANLANILTFYPFMRGGLSTFASGISVTMISRLMLNLHENANAGIYSTMTHNTHMEYISPPVEIELDTI